MAIVTWLRLGILFHSRMSPDVMTSTQMDRFQTDELNVDGLSGWMYDLDEWSKGENSSFDRCLVQASWIIVINSPGFTQAEAHKPLRQSCCPHDQQKKVYLIGGGPYVPMQWHIPTVSNPGTGHQRWSSEIIKIKKHKKQIKWFGIPNENLISISGNRSDIIEHSRRAVNFTLHLFHSSNKNYLCACLMTS